MLNFTFYLVMVLFIIVCLFMVLLVLIQKGRGGGLASAFGGAGANTAFGSKTGDVLTWATSVVFGIFLILAVALNLMADRMTSRAPLAGAGTMATETPAAASTPPVQVLPPTTTTGELASPAAGSTTAPTVIPEPAMAPPASQPQ